MARATPTFVPFRVNFPKESTTLPVKALSGQLDAMFRAALPAGIAPRVVLAGWDYTNSKTRNEASPGTAAAPARAYFVRSGAIANDTEWIKFDLTWNGTPAVTKVAVYHSSDNEGSYVPMLDERGNYVCTITYSGADITSTAWGNTP